MREHGRDYRLPKEQRWRIAVLLMLAVLVYANALFNSFTYDDFPYVLNNNAVTHPTLKSFLEATRGNNVFRPVTYATFSLNWMVGNVHGWGYHLFNVLLHALVTVLLFVLLRRLLEGVRNAETIAFVAALLFAVLPIHTEAVASISGRAELLAAGFVMGAWLLHLRDRPAAALLCFGLALLSKESAVAFVPLAVLGDYLQAKWKPLGRYGGISAVAVAYVGVLWKVQGGRFGEIHTHFLDNPLVNLSVMWRILNALRIAWKYVGLQIYPATLTCEYSYNALPAFESWRQLLPAAGATLLVVALWVWAMAKKRMGWALAGAIYFAGFAVTANILIPIGTIMGERLAYLPSAGFCLAAALVVSNLAESRIVGTWAVLVVLLAAYGGRTVVRNVDWRSNFSLFSATVKASPASARAHSNLGTQYLEQGKLDLASREFETALGIFPDLPDALELYGIIQARQGNDEKALLLLQHALAVTRRESTRYDERVVTLAAMLVKVGRDGDALPLLDAAIGESPGNARAWSNRAVIRYRRGETNSARSDAETALRLDPYNGQARDLLRALGSQVRSEVKP
jgi:tetratricopeptide (TPR) repeat protein